MKMVQRILFCLLILNCHSAKSAVAAADDVIASYHFVGATALANNTNAARLREIWAFPETMKLRDDVLQKLSRASLKVSGLPEDAQRSALLRPLLDDLLAVESVAELRGADKAKATLVIAARLTEERARIWEANLRHVAKGSESQPLKIDGKTGWQAKAGKNILQFIRAEKWTVVSLGKGQITAEFLKTLGKSANVSTEKNWLEADINWPRLQGLLPLNKVPLKLARTDLKISAKDGNLRTTARIIYPGKIDWKSESWKIPKELIRDPLISFTAVQRIAPFLAKPILPAQTASNPETNQIFFWGQSQMPFQFYGAIPVGNATNTLKALGPQLATEFNDDMKRRDAGKLNMGSNRVDLIWQGLPIIVPFLRPAKEKSGAEFLMAGLFPIAPNTNQAPAELFARISGRKDLVFYDWEITQERLAQWSMIGQLLPIFAKEPIVSTNAALQNKLGPARMPELKWIGTVGTKLGNTVTEVTYKSPNELNVVRKSHIGLNSIELILLSHWLAHPDFPSVNPFVTRHGVAEQSPSPNFKTSPPKP